MLLCQVFKIIFKLQLKSNIFSETNLQVNEFSMCIGNEKADVANELKVSD